MADDEIQTSVETAEPIVPEVASAAVIEAVAPAKVRKPRKAKAVAPVAASVVAPEPVMVPAKRAVAKNAPAKPAAKPARVAKAPAPAEAIKPAKTTKTLSGGAGVPSFKPVSETFAMTDFTAVIQTAFTDAQGKAKAAYEKGTASLTEAGTFAQGNVEAMVESSKIFAEGLQKLGASLVADSKETFEGLTSEVKELTAVKSPADFFKLQSDLMKKYFDTTVAYSSKQSEALMKLTTEATSPLSRRMTLAMEKLKAA